MLLLIRLDRDHIGGTPGLVFTVDLPAPKHFLVATALRLLFGLALLTGPRCADGEEPPPLGKGSLSAEGMAGQTFNHYIHGFAETAVPTFEVSRFVGRRMELGVELHPAFWIGQPQTRGGEGRENVVAVAADLILRWYPRPVGSRITPYVEVAEGPCWSPDRVPVAGTRFNFMTQAGIGLVLRTGTTWSTVVGSRWVHISNANLGAGNPGWSFVVLLLGGRLFIP